MIKALLQFMPDSRRRHSGGAPGLMRQWNDLSAGNGMWAIGGLQAATRIRSCINVLLQSDSLFTALGTAEFPIQDRGLICLNGDMT
jgi:hypothetical protein